MIFANVKNEKERQLLNKAIREAKDKNWYCRLIVIKFSSQGKTVRHIGKELSVCEATIRSYIHSYNKAGLDGLQSRKPTGRPPKLGNWSKRDWEKVLKRAPYCYEKLNTRSDRWTLELMARYLVEYQHIKVCVTSIYNSARGIKKV